MLRGSLRSAAALPRACRSQSTISKSAYETTFERQPSQYGWRYHIDNTIQFVLWASFGSAAIHLLNIKQKYEEKERKLSTKIALLKDVIQRIGKGENVDVEKELRVGHFEAEAEWQEVMDSFRQDAKRDVPDSGQVAKVKSVQIDNDTDLERMLEELSSSEASQPIPRKWFRL